MAKVDPHIRRTGKAAISGMSDREIESDPARAMAIAQAAMRAVVETSGLRPLAERVARRVCMERCAYYGDPPCHEVLFDQGQPFDGLCGSLGPGDGEPTCLTIGKFAEEEAKR